MNIVPVDKAVLESRTIIMFDLKPEPADATKATMPFSDNIGYQFQKQNRNYRYTGKNWLGN